jgi:8-amino-3,8-dideoxy-alpha-D-manno-octulosonate transaminase
MTKDMLALYGGKPARSGPWPRTYPGAMAIGSEEEQAVLEVLRSHALFRYYGPHGENPTKVRSFEQAFARYTGAKYALGVTSGTAAVMTALAAAGVGPGDEVIIPAYTWIATATAVVWNMGIPVVAEVDETLTLDPADVERKITPRTKAIAAVHMRGAPCNMDRLVEIARKHNLMLIEDTAQANGGTLHGKHLGTFGDLGAFSLQFNKMITTGEGGAVVTNNAEHHRRAQMYHDGGGIWRRGEGITASLDELGQFTGVNFRMPEIVGAIAGVQLKRLDGLVAKQREIKTRIIAGTKAICQKKGFAPRPSHDESGDVGVCLIYLMPSAEAAKSVSAALRAENISAGGMFDPNTEDLHVYYHWSPILKKRTANALGCPWTCPYYKGQTDYDQQACPKTLDLLARAVHIDITPLLSDEDIQATIEGISKVAEALL